MSLSLYVNNGRKLKNKRKYKGEEEELNRKKKRRMKGEDEEDMKDDDEDTSEKNYKDDDEDMKDDDDDDMKDDDDDDDDDLLNVYSDEALEETGDLEQEDAEFLATEADMSEMEVDDQPPDSEHPVVDPDALTAVEGGMAATETASLMGEAAELMEKAADAAHSGDAEELENALDEYDLLMAQIEETAEKEASYLEEEDEAEGIDGKIKKKKGSVLSKWVDSRV
jgi:Ino eighty subunit 2